VQIYLEWTTIDADNLRSGIMRRDSGEGHEIEMDIRLRNASVQEALKNEQILI
jgi:hypothetical protein